MAYDASVLHGLTTPHLADACMRVGVQVRCCPSGLRPISEGMRCSGRVLTASHTGGVDVFLEALMQAERGDVQTMVAGLMKPVLAISSRSKPIWAGIVIDGLHRDTTEIKAIGIPLFSLGALPTGPQRNGLTRPATPQKVGVGRWSVDQTDYVVADADGAIFLPGLQILAAASNIRDIEKRQAESMRRGISLREQTKFELYLRARQTQPGYGFREHLRTIGRAIEE